jgi:phosphoglycerate dehydrogenase-like enzyme
MMDLVHSHSYTKLYDNQKKKLWDQKVGMNVSDRVGKRVGVLGYGSIGRQGTLMTRFMIFPGWISLPMLVEEMSAS